MRKRSFATFALLAVSSSVFAFADAVTLNTNANQLAAAMTAGNTGVTIVSATLQGQSNAPNVESSGTFTNIYGLPTGVAISTGNAAEYGSGPSDPSNNTIKYSTMATSAQNAMLDPLTNGNMDHYDVTELDLTFTVDPGNSQIFFNVAFGSDEFDTFVGTQFVDAFGIYLNGVNIAFVDGQPVNIDNSCFTFMGGTQLNGVLACNNNPVNVFSGAVNPGLNTLTFIISDTSDDTLDTTAYIGSLGTTDISATPEPSSIALFGTGLLAAAGAIRRRLMK
jgi:PEP-CTERM motif